MAFVSDFIAPCRKNFMQLLLEKKLYNTLEGLQSDIDQWINFYNIKRQHSDRHCFGKPRFKHFLKVNSRHKTRTLTVFSDQMLSLNCQMKRKQVLLRSKLSGIA